MPILPNVRQERFARAYVKTGLASRSYMQAGYEPGTPQSLWTNASRMLRHDPVRRRIDELRAMQNVKHRITVESLLSELADARLLAMATKQPGAAIQATTVAAKLVGLMVDRKESGAPGDFASLQNTEEILAKVSEELGPELAAALRTVLAKADESSEPEQASGPALLSIESTVGNA